MAMTKDELLAAMRNNNEALYNAAFEAGKREAQKEAFEIVFNTISEWVTKGNSLLQKAEQTKDPLDIQNLDKFNDFVWQHIAELEGVIHGAQYDSYLEELTNV